ncbi:MAG: OmpA family protein [Rhodobacteraceae bacterium]|nr:OmpA family protein [Paracoccaceae bacterium]
MTLQFSRALALSLLVVSAPAAQAADCRLTVYFGLDRADLSPRMQMVLLNFMQHNPKAHGSVIGYTDALASQAYNLDLSRRRALTVIRFIEDYSANSVRLATDWRGKLDPVVDTQSAEPLNRRVEIGYHDCTPVTFLTPLPVGLRGYEAPADDDHHHHPDGPGGSSSASAGPDGASASGGSGSGSSAASAGPDGASASGGNGSGASAASAGPGGASASNGNGSGSSAASAGPGGASASSGGGSGSSAASAGSGGASASSSSGN